MKDPSCLQGKECECDFRGLPYLMECKPITRDLLPPLDGLTTYREEYDLKPTARPCIRRPEDNLKPKNCRTQNATTNLMDFYAKRPYPNCGPIHGLPRQFDRMGKWSQYQLLQPFTCEITSSQEGCPRRFGCPSKPVMYPSELSLDDGLPRQDRLSETADQFYPRCLPPVPYSPVADLDCKWLPSTTPMDECTSYNHFFRKPPQRASKICNATREVFPSCAVSGLCYSGNEHEMDDEMSVEVRDNDPWPFVTRGPIRTQDNLFVDPCELFRGRTTQKECYTPKYVPKVESFRRWEPYLQPILPMVNGTTTMKDAFRVPRRVESKNPNDWTPYGIKWEPETQEPYSQCLVLKPNSPCNTGLCCGPYDFRSMHRSTFNKLSPDEVFEQLKEQCRKPHEYDGLTTYRESYVDSPDEHRPVVFPPPSDTVPRVLYPGRKTQSSIDNSLYRLTYVDNYQVHGPHNIEHFRGQLVAKPKDHIL